MKFIYKESALISSEDIQKAVALLTEYSAHLKKVAVSNSYEEAESSIVLPSDSEMLKKVFDLKQRKVTPQLKYIIDIGIGGSNLGTKAVYDALFGYYDTLRADRFPKIIFLDTTNDRFLVELATLINSFRSTDEFIVNAISKSGGTTETVANLEVTLKLFENKFGNIDDRVVITTDENSKLWDVAAEKGVATLGLPKQVGGRFSVLSAVGLFPLVACGIDIESLLKGAVGARDICVTPDLDNPALISAVITYLHNQNHKNINDTFLFLPQLESMGKWYRQLMGESVGKEHNLSGEVVHAGVTPTVSIGSTDLHSVGQLYLGGPRDKVTTFVYSEENTHTHKVPLQLQYPLVDGIASKSISEISEAILEGVKIAYQKQGLPYMEVIIDTIDEKSLGEFLQFKMIEMMYLGKLLNVNTFDQPHVELYKIETKKILNK